MLSFTKLNKVKKISMFHTSSTQNNTFNWIIDAKVNQIMDEQAKTKDEIVKIKEDYHQLVNSVKEQNNVIIELLRKGKE